MDQKNLEVSRLRQNYLVGGLRREEVGSDPIAFFGQWFEEAMKANILEPNAMTLATTNKEGHPSARTVLLKGVAEEGFEFYTNYHSRKGLEMEKTRRASLVFFWRELERQVTIRGEVEMLPQETSERYFAMRPRGSQLGAWVSEVQSQAIENRSVLEECLEDMKQRFSGQDVPKPPFWGGYLVRPIEIEFWQGRESRLHDRLRFRRESIASQWTLERLSP